MMKKIYLTLIFGLAMTYCTHAAEYLVSKNEAATSIFYLIFLADSNYVSTEGGSTIIPSAASIKGISIKAFSGQTAHLQSWINSANTEVSYIRNDGALFSTVGIRTPAIQDAGNVANSAVSTGTSGTVISRNIADSNPALIVNQANASSTGDIIDVQFNSQNLFSVPYNGLSIFRSISNNSGSGRSVLTLRHESTYSVTGLQAPFIPVQLDLAVKTNTSDQILSRISSGLNSSTDRTSGYLSFSTASSGVLSEALRISSDNSTQIKGNIGIGISPSSSISLSNGVPITGSAIAYANKTATTIQSDVTNSAVGYATSLSTAAAPFTLNGMYHFSADQNTIGLGATINNQIGFYAQPSLVGATNNYGFKGGIPAGTGRWNLYMDGTANNYMAGNLGIGTISPDAKLAVNGTIHSKEVKVDLNVPAPDYVFNPDYSLITLKEVKDYIDQNQHLPDIPSAEQMAKDGLNVSEMNMKLLKKVEELTLYLIEKDRQLNDQQTQMQQLRYQQMQADQEQQKQIDQLKERLIKLTQ